MMSKRAHKAARALLGTRLRQLRKAQGLSQERLAGAAGISGKFVGEVERGEKSISFDALCWVASALEMRVGELADLPIDGARAAAPAATEELLAYVRANASKLVRRRALRVLRALAGTSQRA